MKKSRFLLIIAFLFCSNIVVIHLSAQPKATRGERAAALIQAFLTENKISGMAVSVGIEGKIAWSDGFGYADLEQRVPVWPALTRFRVGSVAKPMTATAIAQLLEQGKLDLDVPIQNYVPSFPEKEGIITTRLLAGHLAGIRHYKNDEFLSAKHYETVLEGLEIFQNDPLLHPPGTKYKYSSYAWNLLSAIVEGASATNFLQYMNNAVFKPFEMNHTIADHVDSIIVNRSRYYELQEGNHVNSPYVDNSYKWAGGGFLSTSEDLVRFGFAHLDTNFLKKETIELLWTPQQTTAGESTNYGLGWRIKTDDQGRRHVGHGGGSVGGSTFFGMYPAEQVVLVIISNMSDVGYGELPDQIYDVFME